MQAPTIVLARALPITTTNDMPFDNPTNEMDSEAAIEAIDKYLSVTSSLVVMSPVKNHLLYDSLQ